MEVKNIDFGEKNAKNVVFNEKFTHFLCFFETQEVFLYEINGKKLKEFQKNTHFANFSPGTSIIYAFNNP